MSLNLPAAAYNAMAKQAKRVQRELTPEDEIRDLKLKLAEAEQERDTALKEVQRLNDENDALARMAHYNRKSKDGDETVRLNINGRDVVSQAEAAKLLNVDAYKVSRWVKAKKLETITVPGRKKPMIPVDVLTKPEPGKPGRKKK